MNGLIRHLRAITIASDRLLWAVRVRWLVISGFFGLAVAARLIGELPSLQPCAVAALAGFTLNSVNHLCVKNGRLIVPVIAVAIPFDHVLITYVVIHTGGVVSPFIMMYFVQVVTTAMLVDAVVAVASAGIAVVAWTAGLGLAGVPEVATIGILDSPSPPHVLMALWAAFLMYCLGLLVYVGGYIGDRLRSSEAELAERNRRLSATLVSLQTAYDKLKQTESRLVHAEKMRSLGQLVAGVAHELNNPISFISANVEHLRTYMSRLSAGLQAYSGIELSAPERARIEAVRSELRLESVLADLPGLLDDCEEGARRSKEIVGELRTFSRNDEGARWRMTDLRRGLDTTIGLLGHRLKAHVRLHRQYGDAGAVECLPGQINQVFMNIIANAADAIGDRPGNIWIDVASVDEDGSATARVRVTIRDDGAGMTSAVAGRIFEPFFTTKDVGQGTGMGLAVSYAIIERHDGQIAVQSTPGMGTTFVVTLPTKQIDDGEHVDDGAAAVGAGGDDAGVTESGESGVDSGHRRG